MDKFSIAWSGFNESAGNSFRSLHAEDVFTDITLVCDDDKEIKAHKVVLVSSSKLFRKILTRNPQSHPLVYLRGATYSLLQNIIEFMYLGSVEVPQQDFQSFLDFAKDLQILGLTDFEKENTDTKLQEKVEGKNNTTEKEEVDTLQDQEEDEKADIEIATIELMIPKKKTDISSE